MIPYTKKISIIFVLLQTILYLSFLRTDLTDGSVTLSCAIKYSVIILCFCYALFLKKSADKGIIFCTLTGLFFTLISDLFILLLDYYFYGVLTFIIVQQLYGIRISMADGLHDEKKRHIPLVKSFLKRLVLQLAAAVVICLILKRLGVEMEALVATSVFYFICIFTNTVNALFTALRSSGDKGMKYFAAGMTLFLLCDINVGLFNLSGFISLSNQVYQMIYSLSSILMWFFYAPSQVLIALSVTAGHTVKEF